MRMEDMKSSEVTDMSAAPPGIRHESTASIDHVAKRRNPMESLIETMASGMGNTIGFLAETGVLFAIFAILWAAFAVALIWSHGSLDAAWQSVRSLPLIVQGIVWVLFLPVMIGLWVWETTWPLILRLVVVLGIAGWNLLVFLPRALQAARP
jgi:ABC-type amino acid transport system permease subunit